MINIKLRILRGLLEESIKNIAATMCKADYLGKSIPDKEHLAMYVKDTVDDVDASDETTFRRWVATMIGNGLPIDWYEIC